MNKRQRSEQKEFDDATKTLKALVGGQIVQRCAGKEPVDAYTALRACIIDSASLDSPHSVLEINASLIAAACVALAGNIEQPAVIDHDVLVSDSRLMPDWVTCPGEALQEWFDNACVPMSMAWNLYDIPEDTFQRILAGDEELTAELIVKISRMTHTPVRFWERLEELYRAGLAAGLAHPHGQ